MEDFDGPLDLILHLLSKNKIEIRDIQITLLLDQYLDWMARREQLNLEVASEFVTMAAHLVYIKTRMLLSIDDEEAMSEMEQLMAALEERKYQDSYLRVKAAVSLWDGGTSMAETISPSYQSRSRRTRPIALSMTRGTCWQLLARCWTEQRRSCLRPPALLRAS